VISEKNLGTKFTIKIPLIYSAEGKKWKKTYQFYYY
jgi:hypothetical protein